MQLWLQSLNELNDKLGYFLAYPTCFVFLLYHSHKFQVAPRISSPVGLTIGAAPIHDFHANNNASRFPSNVARYSDGSARIYSCAGPTKCMISCFRAVFWLGRCPVSGNGTQIHLAIVRYLHIRLHPTCNNINRESGIEIPEAWLPTIKKNNRKTLKQRTDEGTATRRNNGTIGGSKYTNHRPLL